MRTLNKTLCLVLALVLCLSLVGSAFAFNTDSFTDAGKIGKDYFEAVDVLVGIGIINGTSPTTLEPQGQYTREQAAKIITFMRIGEDAANNLKALTDPFGDVSKDRWSAPYIQYCVEQNIIVGAGDGNFYPERIVSGYEMGKMVLAAIGYNANDEYEGESWAINVARDAINLGIYGPKSMQPTLATDGAITREQAIYIAWQGLFKPTVTWNTLLDQYVTGNIFGAGEGNVIVTTTKYGTLAEVVFGVGRIMGGLISTQFSVDSLYAELWAAEDEKYDGKAVFDLRVHDSMKSGIVGHQYRVYFWLDAKYFGATSTAPITLTVKKGGLIGFYEHGANKGRTDVPIIPGVTTAKLANTYLAAAGLSFDTEDPTPVFINGDYAYALTEQSTSEKVAKEFLDDYFDGLFNDYTFVDYNEDGIIDAVVAEKFWVAQVDSQTSTTYYFEGNQISIKKENAIGDTPADGEVVCLYPQYGTFNTTGDPTSDSHWKITKAILAKGMISKYESISGVVVNATVGDKVYATSSAALFPAGADVRDNAPAIVNNGLEEAPKNVNTEEVTLYLDPYGAVLGFTGVKAASGVFDLAFILEVGVGATPYGVEEYYAYVLFADGTKGSYKINKFTDGVNNDPEELYDEYTSMGGDPDYIYNVTVRSDGKVDIKDVYEYTKNFTYANMLDIDAPTQLIGGNAYLGSGFYDAVYATDKTVYFYANGLNPYAAGFKSAVFTGYKNSSSLNDPTNVDVLKDAVYGATSTQNAAAVAVVAEDGWKGGVGADVFFYNGTDYDYVKTGTNKVEITYTLYKDGVKEAYKVATVGTVDPEVPEGFTYQGNTMPPAGFYKKSAVTSDNKTGLTAVAVFGNPESPYLAYQMYNTQRASFSNGVLAAVDMGNPVGDRTYFTTEGVKVIDVRAQATTSYTGTSDYGEITTVAGIKQAYAEGYNVLYHVAYAKPDADQDGSIEAPYTAKYIYISILKNEIIEEIYSYYAVTLDSSSNPTAQLNGMKWAPISVAQQQMPNAATVAGAVPFPDGWETGTMVPLMLRKDGNAVVGAGTFMLLDAEDPDPTAPIATAPVAADAASATLQFEMLPYDMAFYCVFVPQT